MRNDHLGKFVGAVSCCTVIRRKLAIHTSGLWYTGFATRMRVDPCRTLRILHLGGGGRQVSLACRRGSYLSH